MNVPTPEEMRLLVTKIARTYEWDAREREVLHFMIGYYRIDYPHKEEEE